MTELSDELLVAYVDGQLARKQTRAIDRVLEEDDVLDARVIALKHAHARLEAAFEAILAGEEAEISTIVAEPLDDGFWVPWRTFQNSRRHGWGLDCAGARGPRLWMAFDGTEHRKCPWCRCRAKRGIGS